MFRLRRRLWQRLVKHIVGITIAPLLARFERLDDGVLCRVKMFCRVAVLRIVTTADVTADLTKTEMDPLTADLQTIFTAVGARSDLADLRQMFTGFHIVSSFYLCGFRFSKSVRQPHKPLV